MIKLEPIKPLTAAGKVGVGLDDDMADGMQCSDHPFHNNAGGICAFCLQDKLGKLVSSSLPLPIRAASSSPSSPSLGSETSIAVINGAAAATASSSSDTANDCRYHDQYHTRRARIPFLKKKKVVTGECRAKDIVFKRSKSTATPRRGRFMDADDGGEFSPRKRGFWSFLYPTSSKAPKKVDKNVTNLSTNGTIMEEDESPTSQTGSASSFERKVSRSRSVGCGSRSFSGDFFERISTGFGDCTLRRVESQRESKAAKAAGGGSSGHRNGGGVDHHCIKERVKCGGLFGGFMISSSSSSSSSSSYWVSSSADELNRKPTPTAAAGPVINGRSKSWGWAFASPMRAFSSKPSNHKDRKRSIIRQASENNTTPDLNAIPSLLAVRS